MWIKAEELLVMGVACMKQPFTGQLVKAALAGGQEAAVWDASCAVL